MKHRTDTYGRTACVLQWSALIAAAVTAAGLAAAAAGIGYGNEAVRAGVFILIVSPFLGLIVSAASLVYERDRNWAAAAAVLIAVTLLGTAAAWFM